jgi:hypothetical protein
MPTLTGPSTGTGTRGSQGEVRAVTRILEAAYARERIEDVIRAVAEDALNPGRSDVLPWRDEAAFDHDLEAVVREIAAAANVLLTSRLTDLLESAPPRVAERLAATPRWQDQA